MSDNNEGAEGFLDQQTTSSEYNAFFFKVMGILAQNNFVVPVKVMAVTSAGELAVTGLIDVRPLVNQERADGVTLEHGIIHNVPYLRMQGGTNAIIMDPVVGDIGMMVCADKDISALKSTKETANAGSGRVHDYSDGVYTGGMLNGVPEQYIQFSESGIKMFSPSSISLEAEESITLTAPSITFDASEEVTVNTPTFTVNGDTFLNGPVNASETIDAGGAVTAPNVTGTNDVIGGGKSLKNHTHRAQGATAITTAPL